MLRRVRLGERIALAGAIAAIVALTVGYYRTAAGGSLNAWDTFDAAIVLLLLAIAAAIAMVLSALRERSPAVPIAAAVWSTLFALVASVAAIVRVLERPDSASSLKAGAWLALGGALAMLVGSWQAMRDERTELYDPPHVEPRPPPA
jgi:RsiW-degrading membrane proteinase PrsW (M82 family)